jgi:hypothetical protein
MNQTLSNPVAVRDRLEEIERDLAMLQNDLEEAAFSWFRSKRDKEKERARVFMQSEGSVEARKAQADLATAHLGADDEARYEALRSVARVLDTRAAIGMAILKSQGRA